LKFKDGIVEKQRIEYVRGVDLKEYLTKNIEAISTELKDFDLGNNLNYVCQKFFEIYYAQEILVKLARPADDKKLKKYPKKLVKDKKDKDIFEEEKFYLLNIKRAQSSIYFYLALIVGGIVLFYLLPIWPLELKLFLWWVSYILLIIIFSVLSVRFIFYCLIYQIGYIFWIFPDLLNEKYGVFESFYRLYSIEKAETTLAKILFRVSITSFIIYIAFYIYSNPDAIDQLIDHTKEAYKDIFESVNEKIINHHNGTQISVTNKHDEYMRKIIDEGIKDD